MPVIKDNSFAKEEIKSELPNSLNSDKGLEKKPSGLINTIGSLLPLAPVLFEQWTGQKIPPMTGTLAEMNTSLSQLSLTLNQVLNNQQQLWTKLENLEKGANHQFTQLGNQFQSLRLTHTREQRQIEYSPKEENPC